MQNEDEEDLDSEQEVVRNLTSSNRVFAQTHVNMSKSAKDVPYMTNTNLTTNNRVSTLIENYAWIMTL